MADDPNRQRYHVGAHSEPARWDDCHRCIAMYAAARCPSCPSALTVRGNAAICENNHRWVRDAERPDWREAIWDETIGEAGGWATDTGHTVRACTCGHVWDVHMPFHGCSVCSCHVDPPNQPLPLAQRIDGWLEWVAENLGPSCSYDHEGLCQAHHLDPRPCPMEGIVEYVRGLHGITS